MNGSFSLRRTHTVDPLLPHSPARSSAFVQRLLPVADEQLDRERLLEPVNELAESRPIQRPVSKRVADCDRRLHRDDKLKDCCAGLLTGTTDPLSSYGHAA